MGENLLVLSSPLITWAPRPTNYAGHPPREFTNRTLKTQGCGTQKRFGACVCATCHPSVWAYRRNFGRRARGECKRGTSRHNSTGGRWPAPIRPSRITKREILGEIAAKTGMPAEANTPSAIEQAISRALRDNLERIQRASDELHQAIADVVAACGSTKPINSLAPM